MKYVILYYKIMLFEIYKESVCMYIYILIANINIY